MSTRYIVDLVKERNDLQSKLKAATELVEKLQKEIAWLIHPSKTIQHKEWCELNRCYHPLNCCTCGLDDLRKQIDAIGK